MRGIDHSIVVVVAEYPVVVPCLLSDLSQKVRELICSVVVLSPSNSASRCTMRNNIVYLPADAVKVLSGLGVLLTRRKLLSPPRNMFRAASDIMAHSAAHGEEPVAIQFEYLPAHQVQDVGSNALDLAAAPHFYRVNCQRIKVFMIAVYKRQRERQTFQPVQRSVVAAVAEPYPSEITGNDNDIVLCQFCLLRKVFRLEPFKIPMRIA